MTTTSRREEYSSNIIRSLHPTQHVTTSVTSSSNNLNENIDYLLDDLQNSVSGTSQYLQSKNVQHLSPANTTTYIKERSVSPGRTSENVYKTSSYQYSTSSSTGGISGKNTGMLESSQGVNQLDVLLQDLKKERELSTREKDYSLTSYNSSLESEKLGSKSPNFSGTRAIRDEINVKRDVVYDSMSSQGSPKWNVSASTPSEKSHTYEKKIETSSTRDVTFGDSPNIRSTPTLTRSEKYIENKTVPYYEEKSQLITSHEGIPDDLKNVPLSDDILPVPGTKVTTTVRTYTYEIPAEPTSQTSKKLLYKREINANETSQYPERELPSSITYKTESYRTTNRNVPTIQSTRTITTNQDIKDSTFIDRNVEFIPDDQPLTENTVHYRDVIETKGSPPSSYPPAGSPGGPVTYYYKHHETTNTKNTLYGPPGSPPNEPYYPPEQSYPNKTITYRNYSSSQHTTSGGEREPLLHPAPFPTDNVDISGPIEGPPKRLDDLMASLGNENVNAKDVERHISRREVETGVATAERPPPSKNVSGPPVYYPPGREMFMKKEEGSAAYRAGGGYASAAAKYEYEADSKSKSKSKTKATMIPVCLPLCCAMPCSIM